MKPKKLLRRPVFVMLIVLIAIIAFAGVGAMLKMDDHRAAVDRGTEVIKDMRGIDEKPKAYCETENLVKQNIRCCEEVPTPANETVMFCDVLKYTEVNGTATFQKVS